MQIRTSEQEDLAELSKMICEILRSIQSPDYKHAVIEKMCSHFSQAGLFELSKSREIFVAILNDHVAGTASLKGNLILSVFVKRAHQRMGIGTILINHLEDLTRTGGHHEVKIPASTDSADFYMKLGYLEEERVISDFGPNIIMTKSLLVT